MPFSQRLPLPLSPLEPWRQLQDAPILPVSFQVQTETPWERLAGTLGL